MSFFKGAGIEFLPAYPAYRQAGGRRAPSRLHFQLSWTVLILNMYEYHA
jgi:hypothetical protein